MCLCYCRQCVFASPIPFSFLVRPFHITHSYLHPFPIPTGTTTKKKYAKYALAKDPGGRVQWYMLLTLSKGKPIPKDLTTVEALETDADVEKLLQDYYAEMGKRSDASLRSRLGDEGYQAYKAAEARLVESRKGAVAEIAACGTGVLDCTY
jgi:hypothetical protein